MNDKIVGAVVEFLRKQIGVRSDVITPQTDLVHDLGIDGEDGIELMKAFSREFSVDLSGFTPARYFGPESGPSIINTFLAFFRRGRRRPVRGLTVAHLAEAAVSGAWNDEPKC